jgi:hypothetical protein
MDSGFRRNDGKKDFRTLYENIKTKSLLSSLYQREELPSLEKRGWGRFFREWPVNFLPGFRKRN